MAKVFMIYNQKGGSGKTHVTINLAGFFAFNGYKTLVIDLDPQGDSSVLIKPELDGVEDGVRSIFNPDANEIISYSVDYSPNLFISPSFYKVRTLERQLWGESYLTDKAGKRYFGDDNRQWLSQAIAKVKDDFDIIVIDTPPDHASMFVENSLFASDFLIVPVSAKGLSDYRSVTVAAEQFMEAIYAGKNIRFLGIVYNAVRPSVGGNTVIKAGLQQAKESFGTTAIFNARIKYYEQVNAATFRGKPLVFQSEKIPSVKNFNDFYKEVCLKAEIKPVKI